MTIWDDLYKDLVKSELKQDGVSPLDNDLKTVEAKVEELRQRVGLDAVRSMTKEASIVKSASQEGGSSEDKVISEMKAYIAGLVDLRRGGIELLPIMHDLRDRFQEHKDLIRDNVNELEEYATKRLEKFKVNLPAPLPMLFNKPEGGKEGEDNKIFENIADKLKS